MLTKFALRLKGTDKFLSTAPARGRRQFGHVEDAQLWSKRHHASLAANFRDEKNIEIVQFGVLLVDAKKGYVG